MVSYGSQLFVLCGLVVTASAAAKGLYVVPYNGEMCRSSSLGGRLVEAGSGCITDGVGQLQSFTVRMPDDAAEDEENRFMLVAYSSDNCNPDTVVSYTDSGCVNRRENNESKTNILSYEVWDVYLGKFAPDITYDNMLTRSCRLDSFSFIERWTGMEARCREIYCCILVVVSIVS